MANSLLKDMGPELGFMYAAANTAVTAGGSGDATLVTGVTIDTMAATTNGFKPTDFNGIIFVVGYTTTLTATKGISVTALVEDSADGSSWATFVASKTIINYTSTPGGTFTGTGKIGADLTGARRYVRVKFTPDLSATATDTAAISCQACLTGGTYMPVP